MSTVTPPDAVYALLYALSTLAAITLAMVVLRRRARDVVVGMLTAYLLANAVWSAAALSGALAGEQGDLLVSPVVMPTVAVVVAATLGLFRAVADPTWRPSRRFKVLVAVHPAVMLAAGATDRWHHSILVEAPDGVRFGWLFWVHTGVSYALLAWAILRLLRDRRTAGPLQRRRITTLLLAGAVPIVGNALTISAVGPDGRDLTPVFFMVNAAIVTYAILRQRLLDVVPVARARVLEILGDAVVVLDEVERVADLNAAARRLLAVGGVTGEVLGQHAATSLGPFAGAILGPAGERLVVLDRLEMTLDVRSTELADVGQGAAGRVVVARDVTDEIVRRDALAEANAVLQINLVTIERLRAEVAERAARDAMTGLHNRRHLDQVFPRLLRSQPADGPLSVVLVDVDHFKAVNDTHGHAVGDRMLVAVAGALAAAVRGPEVVVRYGGEEFVVLLPGTPRDEAGARAEELRAACATARVPVRGSHLAVSASAGVATAGPDRATPSALLDAADAALYRAKRAGRDRTEVAPGPDGPAGEDRGPGAGDAGRAGGDEGAGRAGGAEGAARAGGVRSRTTMTGRRPEAVPPDGVERRGNALDALPRQRPFPLEVRQVPASPLPVRPSTSTAG